MDLDGDDVKVHTSYGDESKGKNRGSSVGDGKRKRGQRTVTVEAKIRRKKRKIEKYKEQGKLNVLERIVDKYKNQRRVFVTNLPFKKD